MIDQDELLEFIQGKRYQPMKTGEIAERLQVGRSEQHELEAGLEDLQRRGEIIHIKDQWVRPDDAGLAVGRLQCNARGFGFVLPAKDDREDIYVAEEDMNEAMNDDLVVVELHPKRGRGRRGKKVGPSGRIIKVLEHFNTQIIGTFQPGKRFGRVLPENPRLFRDVYVAREDWKGAGKDDTVLVEITSWPTFRRNPEGVVQEVLGKVGDPRLDVESVILEFGLPREFPPKVKRAAEKVSADIPTEEMERRRDLRDYTTVTIDPEDAKDFDDALSFYRDSESGRRVVLVHIADLSYHVEPDGVLDLEARQRGTSVYLANDVVPMLPHKLSKEILSVVEGQDRVAKTVAIEYNDDGSVHDYTICHSIVHVDRRMSYTEVQKALEELDQEPEERDGFTLLALPGEIVDVLEDLDSLAGDLRRLRREVGSIDLDVPDYHVDVGEDGRVVAVSEIIRDRSHGLVEEFMLSANRCVADFLIENRLPGLYRVHDEPLEEDLEAFGTFIESVLGKKVDVLDRRQLQDLLAEVAGTNLADAVNMQLLRAMQRAVYCPSCRPHFALHFDRYCHFTSPVRRYPDLVVHQVLDQHLAEGVPAGKVRKTWKGKLQGFARHCTQRQERADEAEREIIKIKLLRYLQDHADEVFDGVVTGVLEFGVFVRLQDFSAEGLIKVQDIRDDFYRFDEDAQVLVGTRTGRTFQLGQPLKVTIEDIDMTRRRLDLLLHEG